MPRAVDGWKICSKCREEKPVNEFHRGKSKLDGLDYWCKTCRLDHSKRYYRANREKLLAQHRKYAATKSGKAAEQRYQRSPKGREVQRAASERHRRTEKGRATQKRIDTRYAQSAKGKQTRRRRRARKAGAEGSHTYAAFAALCEAYGFRCLACEGEFPLEELTEDHIRPLSKGGNDSIDNIQPLCGPCNSHKGTQVIDYRK